MEYAAGANLDDTADATTTRNNRLLFTEVAPVRRVIGK